jgi:hypothetical protein
MGDADARDGAAAMLQHLVPSAKELKMLDAHMQARKTDRNPPDAESPHAGKEDRQTSSRRWKPTCWQDREAGGVPGVLAGVMP